MKRQALFPIAGVRTWLVAEDGDNFFLRSVYHPEIWFPGQPLRAVCHAHAQHTKAPTLDCTCGIYLWREDYLRVHDFPVQRSIDMVNIIYGEAHGWGHIVQHAYGARAEFTQPAAVCMIGSSVLRTTAGKLRSREEVLAKLGRAYGIPVVEPGFKVRKGCECPLCKTATRGFSEFDLSSILPPDDSRSMRKATKKKRR